MFTKTLLITSFYNMGVCSVKSWLNLAPDSFPSARVPSVAWQKPSLLNNLLFLPAARLAAAQGISTVAAPSTGPGPIPQQHPTPEMVTPQPRHPNPQPMQTDPDDFEAKRLEMEAEAAIKAMEMRRLEEEEKRKKREEEEKQAEQKKQVDRARPVTSTQVPGKLLIPITLQFLFVFFRYTMVCSMDRRRTCLFLQPIHSYVSLGTAGRFTMPR